MVDLKRSAALLAALARGVPLAAAAEAADMDLPQAKAALADLADRLTTQAKKIEKTEREEAERMTRAAQKATNPDEIVFAFDGGSRGNPGPAVGVGMALDAGGTPLVERSRYFPEATNNVAEYHGLLAAIDLAKELKVRKLRLQGDSELIVKQLTGEYKVKHKNIIPLFVAALQKLRQFESWEIRHVRREQNQQPDDAVNRVLDQRAPKKKKVKDDLEAEIMGRGET